MTNRRPFGALHRAARLIIAGSGLVSRSRSTLGTAKPLVVFRHRALCRLAGVSIMVLMVGGIASAPAGAAAPTAPAAIQCNPAQSFPGSTAGWQVTCHVTIENTLTDAGATSSVVTTTACLTAAGVVATQALCQSTPSYWQSIARSGHLVTSVNQCNGTATGGGSNVLCDVTVINNIPDTTPKSGVTVNQCIGSASGGEAPSFAIRSGARPTQRLPSATALPLVEEPMPAEPPWRAA